MSSSGITVSFEAVASFIGVGFMSLVGVVYRGITGKVSDLEKSLNEHIKDTKDELRTTNKELATISTSLSRIVGRLEAEAETLRDHNN